MVRELHVMDACFAIGQPFTPVLVCKQLNGHTEKEANMHCSSMKVPASTHPRSFYDDSLSLLGFSACACSLREAACCLASVVAFAIPALAPAWSVSHPPPTTHHHFLLLSSTPLLFSCSFSRHYRLQRLANNSFAALQRFFQVVVIVVACCLFFPAHPR